MQIKELENAKILILGFGQEGIDTFLFLRKAFPKKVIGIADRLEKSKIKNDPTGSRKRQQKSKILKKDRNFKLYAGKNYLKALRNYDLIIKSPGVPIHLPEVERAYKQGKITSQTKIFFENWPGIIVGVTGTKGKSTTASLIYRILKKAGFKVRLMGNIGKPVLSSLSGAKKNEIAVCELSSHQLYNLKKNPQIAVLLNIYPEHLDYYRNFKEYSQAKANIAKYQSEKDYLVFNSSDKTAREIAKKSKAKKIPIKGDYYELDRKAAQAVGKIFKVPEKIIFSVFKNFKGLPHRLEKVGTFKGITFYNDALATIPEATIAAIKKLGDRVETIMLGGFDRNIDFKNLAKEVLKSKIGNIILFPTTGKKMWQALRRIRQAHRKQAQGKALRRAQDKSLRQKHPVVSHIEPFFVDNMEDAVKLAYKHTAKGKICLLSTASSSFSIFKDYKEKGDLFKKYVRKYGKSS